MGEIYASGDTRCLADIALLAHCRNHFMEALAALNRAAARFEDHLQAVDESHRNAMLSDIDDMLEVIAKLEEVNT